MEVSLLLKFANFAQTFVTLVPQNVRNIAITMSTAKSVLKLVEELWMFVETWQTNKQEIFGSFRI